MQRGTIPIAILTGLGMVVPSCSNRVVPGESADGSGSEGTSTGTSGATPPGTTGPGPTGTTGPVTDGSLDTSGADDTSAGSNSASGPHFDIGGTTTDDPPGPYVACEPGDGTGTSTGTGAGTGGFPVPPEDVDACLDCFKDGWCWDLGTGECSEGWTCWSPDTESCEWCGPCLGGLVEDRLPSSDLLSTDPVRHDGAAAGAPTRSDVLQRVLDRGGLPADVLERLRAAASPTGE